MTDDVDRAKVISERFAKAAGFYKPIDYQKQAEVHVNVGDLNLIALALHRIRKTTGRLWRHVQRGSTYLEVGTAKLQISAETLERLGVPHSDRAKSLAGLLDMVECTVYQSTDGTLWVRPLIEFSDGRFVRMIQPQ